MLFLIMEYMIRLTGAYYRNRKSLTVWGATSYGTVQHLFILSAPVFYFIMPGHIEAEMAGITITAQISLWQADTLAQGRAVRNGAGGHWGW